MKDLEDYSRSRHLATVEHGGFVFHVVRQRLNGKPWRKYVVLTYNGRCVAGTLNKGITDPAEAARYFQGKLERAFPLLGTLLDQCEATKQRLKAELDVILANGADA